MSLSGFTAPRSRFVSSQTVLYVLPTSLFPGTQKKKKKKKTTCREVSPDGGLFGPTHANALQDDEMFTTAYGSAADPAPSYNKVKNVAGHKSKGQWTQDEDAQLVR